MNHKLLSFHLLSCLILLICFIHCSSECENGCSGHGKCTVYDMCICYRNWEGNDCGDRTCLFGISVVDSPKGDLDSSDSVDQEVTAINSAQYPYGTTEEFPNMVNSDLQKVYQSAHWYTECSSAGVCNRLTGECECYPGFEGVACHRMKCPSESDQPCNGHGTCQSLHQLARMKHRSTYDLWDQHTSRGCICDKGFYGFDCSMRYCPKGVDPLYFDDVRTVQYPFFFISILTSSPTNEITDGFGKPGFFNLEIYDEFGQGYLTRTLTVPVTCEDLISAIEEIPNDVVRVGETKCFHNGIEHQNAITSKAINITYASLYQHYWSGTKWYTNFEKPATIETGYVSLSRNLTSNALLSGDLFLLQFYGRPGNFKQPIVNLYSDGNRPTMVSPNGQVVATSWTNGQQGMDIDFFPIRCNNVQVRLITTPEGKTYLWGAFRLDYLLKCVQQADFNETNNIEETGYSYDPGSIEYPHLIKLVRSVTDHQDGYIILAVYLESGLSFDYQSGVTTNTGSSSELAFRVLTPAYSLDQNVDALYDVYATRGVLHRIQNGARAEFDFGTKHIYLTNISDAYSAGTTPFQNEIGCDFFFGVEGVGQNTSTFDCLDLNDYFTIIDPFVTKNNPAFLNLYRAESIRKVSFEEILQLGDYNSNFTAFNERKNEQVLITTDLNVNGLSTLAGGTNFQIYRFIPDYDFVYEVHAECSGRGLCNSFEGLCECFHGYTGNACDVQDTVSL